MGYKVNTSNDWQKFRIALTQAGLTTGFFFLRKIALPTTCTFKGFSQAIPQSEGGSVQHGFLNVTMSWLNVTPITAYYIRKYVTDALNGTKMLYLTVPYNDGTKPGRRFIDVSGRPHPIDTAEGGTIDGGGLFYENLQLFVNNVTVINDPATF